MNPLNAVAKRALTIDRFIASIRRDPVTGCWLWLGSMTGDYACFRMDAPTRGNRASWMLFIGEIPDGQHVLHRCDVRACVNPAHLFLGTNDENMQDMVLKGRQAKGEKNGRRKLTDIAVADMRRLHASGQFTHGELGARFGVSKAVARCAILRLTWRHVQ